jgi:hypothetical protein
MWATYMRLGGGKVGPRSRVWSENWMEWVAWRFHAVTKLHSRCNPSNHAPESSAYKSRTHSLTSQDTLEAIHRRSVLATHRLQNNIL